MFRPALSESEIAERLPLWEALTDLFLDGGPDDLADGVIRAAREGGFSVEAVRDILYAEVGPVFYPNLLAVAGNWGDWGSDFVRQKICEYLADRPLPWWKRRIARRAIDLAISEVWPVIEAGLNS